jgi:hypothetical protein
MPDQVTLSDLHCRLPDEVDLGPNRVVSVFQGPTGKQSIFSAERTSGQVQLCVVDDEGRWVVEEIDSRDLDGSFILDSYEQMWLIACWASLLSKPVYEVARMYLSAQQVRTMQVSLGIPPHVHAHFFDAV